MSERACRNCEFWFRGQCRRYAPMPFHMSPFPENAPLFTPVTAADYWCGEFKERLAATLAVSPYVVPIENLKPSKRIAKSKRT